MFVNTRSREMLYPIVLTLLAVQLTEEAYMDNYYNTQEEFVLILRALGHLKTKRIIDVLKQVDRKKYTLRSHFEKIPKKPWDVALTGFYRPLNMEAYALEILKDHLVEGKRVLDVSCGSGYLAVCMALLVGKTGTVVGQLDEELSLLKEITAVTKCIRENNPTVLEGNRIKFIEGDLYEGVPELGPYDVIHVGCSFDFIPDAFHRQLKPGGILMVMKYGVSGYRVLLYDKHLNGTLQKTELPTLPYENAMDD